MSQIIVGTSGFFYKDWKGIFYPSGTRQDDFLEYYSRHFRAVELNFSYYDDKTEEEYNQFIYTITYLGSFYYKFETENCSIDSDLIAEIILLFNYDNEEEIYSLYLKLNLDEEWICDFSFD